MVKETDNGKSKPVLEVNKCYVGNCLEVLKTFPDESLDMCITSPPYWGLRDYGTEGQIWGGDEKCEHEFDSSKRKLHSGSWGKDDNALPHYKNATELNWEVEDKMCNKCGAWNGQLGLEPTPDMFVDHLCDIFDEVQRVLRPHGTCWVNLGDTYANSGYGKGTGSFKNKNNPSTMTPKVSCDLPQKCLVQIPSRFAIEMTNRGWILRNEIIWHKPSCLPSPATDRFTVDFEKMFFFTKNKKYYFKQQLEPMMTQPHAPGNKFHDSKVSGPNDRGGKSQWEDTDRVWGSNNPNMRNKRAVWRVNTASFKDAHFAVYPPKLIETPIDAGCPEWIDKKTGKPRVRELEKQSLQRYELPKDNPNYRPERYEGKYEQGQKYAIYDDKGYTDGREDDEFTPGVVLDPFFGSGTSAEIAMKQGKDWVGIELNDEYEKISQKRLKPTIIERKTKNKSKEFWG
jgi:site-specific DNA-methyltransferase (adenine-specific)